VSEIRHPGLDLVALQKFLLDWGLVLDGALRAQPLSGGRSNLTYLITDNSSRWVLRRPPIAGLTPSAHDMGREFRVTAALRGTDVPVAPTVVFCDDESVLGAPFAVVEHVAGPVIRSRTDLDAFSDAEVDGCTSELVRVLAALHRIDYRGVGLAEFGRPTGYLTRQVQLWAKQWNRVKSTDCRDLDRLHAKLTEAVPAYSKSSIVHGDYRLDNTILVPGAPTRVAAVVDWELSTLGDPITDIAMMCVYRHPAFDLLLGDAAAWTSSRLPSADDIAQRYAVASGRELIGWNFYLALAYFKLAVTAEGIAYRFRAGATVGEGFARAGDSVPEFVAAGLDALRRTRAAWIPAAPRYPKPQSLRE